MAVAVPTTLDNPYVGLIVGTATAVDISCHLRHITLSADQVTADIETFCNPGAEKPTRAKWTFEIEYLQSFGPDASTNAGFWDTLSPHAGDLVTFEVKPENTTSSATNPMATFDTYVPWLTFLDAGIGESSTPTATFSVLGDPVFTTT